MNTEAKRHYLEMTIPSIVTFLVEWKLFAKKPSQSP